MTPEQLHDALSLLDDDLIDMVDAQRRCSTLHKKRWIRWAAIAACLALLIGLPILQLLMRPAEDLSQTMQSTSAATDELNADSTTVSDSSDGISTNATMAGPIDGDSATLAPETRMITVRIQKWQDDSFTATVTASDDVKIPKTGATVLVLFTDAVRTKFSDHRVGYDGAPDPSEFPVGSSVDVCFSELIPSGTDGIFTIYSEILTLN